MQDLKDRVAVVTGAASGIGLALALRFAERGMRLVLADIEPQPLAAALERVRALGAEAIALPTDVAAAAAVEALADAAFARFGRVHVLCNNAGVAVPGLGSAAWLPSLADWQWILGVNLMGVVHGVRAFVPRMLDGGDEGHVVNTASVAGLITGSNPYHVSKHGVTCFTEGLYKDLRRIGARISASVLCPGLIRTDIMKAERNRPAELGPALDPSTLPAAQQQAIHAFEQALDAGWKPEQVAQQVEDAVRADRFYVLPAQAPLLDLVDQRLNDLLARRNPTPTMPLFDPAPPARRG